MCILGKLTFVFDFKADITPGMLLQSTKVTSIPDGIALLVRYS
jgi:hypothetical protein